MVVRQAWSLSGGPHILWLLVGNRNSILQLFIHANWYGEFVGEVLASKLEFVEEVKRDFYFNNDIMENIIDILKLVILWKKYNSIFNIYE